MLPTDPELVSGLPSEEKSIFMGTAVGLSTVILGTSLLRISPLNKPVHLVLGGALGALGGYLMHCGASAMQERVKIGKQFHLKRAEQER